jgi:anti-sigma B factor antagonist
MARWLGQNGADRCNLVGGTTRTQTCRPALGWFGGGAPDPGSASTRRCSIGGYALASTVCLSDHPAQPPRDVPPRVLRHGARTVIWLEGEQDAATVPLLAEAMAKAIAGGNADLVVDLSGVTFLDASTIGVLVRGRNLLALCSGRLTLRSPSRCAKRLLDACLLSGLLERPVHEAVSPVLPARPVGRTAS